MRHDKKGIDVVPIAVVFHVKKMAKRHTCKIKYQEKKKKKKTCICLFYFFLRFVIYIMFTMNPLLNIYFHCSPRIIKHNYTLHNSFCASIPSHIGPSKYLSIRHLQNIRIHIKQCSQDSITFPQWYILIKRFTKNRNWTRYPFFFFSICYAL